MCVIKGALKRVKMYFGVYKGVLRLRDYRFRPCIFASSQTFH